MNMYANIDVVFYVAKGEWCYHLTQTLLTKADGSELIQDIEDRRQHLLVSSHYGFETVRYLRCLTPIVH